ncbi:hypothetical protein [Amycolatopsis suaedae]|uniref:DUF3168 domain-containing protein n=1 Tax=Amycolatopsis suaedae TaxID=2510978 RepID=A0A4Q7J1M7_9PSEU|nr:hypothetical protein [Amycolatopsis suaedae]RZQ59834.1 hypothetical protein EWH70_32490 [Amycolatopsis suaedae]
MAPSLTQIMDGIETRLKTIPGLRVTAYVADQINPPAAVVGVPDVPEYRLTMGRGRFELRFTVTVLVSAALDRVGQRALASYADVAGPNSVPAAIDGDRRLGGLVEECHITSFRVLGLDEVGQIGFYGGEFAVRVVAPGT